VLVQRLRAAGEAPGGGRRFGPFEPFDRLVDGPLLHRYARLVLTHPLNAKPGSQGLHALVLRPVPGRSQIQTHGFWSDRWAPAPSADAIARLPHGYPYARGLKIGRRHKPRQTGPDDEDLGIVDCLRHSVSDESR
jgi:hypothetical protein